MAVQERFYTVHDLMNMPDDGNRYELDEGELIIMPPPGFAHARLSAQFLILLGVFVKANDLGIVIGSDGGYLLYRNPSTGRETVRIPDVSFISKTNRSAQGDDQIYAGAPDLAIEVISPSETHKMIQHKLRNYFRYGVKVVWLVYPLTRQIDVYTSLEEAVTFDGDSVLSGGELLPGFTLNLRDLFAVLD